MEAFFILFSRKIINWESRTRSSSFLAIFILATWFFQLWMIPFGLTVLLGREISYKILTGSWSSGPEELEETEMVGEKNLLISTALNSYYL